MNKSIQYFYRVYNSIQGVGADGGFCDRGGPRNIVYSGNMGTIVPTWSAKARRPRGAGHAF